MHIRLKQQVVHTFGTVHTFATVHIILRVCYFFVNAYIPEYMHIYH